MTKVAKKKKNFNDLFRHFQRNTFSRKFEEASQGFCSMLARAPTLSFVFPETFLCFRFSRSLKAIKKKKVRFGLSFTVVNIMEMVFVFKLGLHEGRRSPAIIWLCLWFSSICLGEISQNFHSFVKIFLLIIYEPKKIGVTKVVSSLFAILCFLSLSQIWSYFFLSTSIRKGTNMFNGPANLRKFHPRKRDKSYYKDPYFLRPKYYVMV